MTTIRMKSIRKTVTRRAKPLMDGLMVFEISHSTSSARTAASAIVVEKVSSETLLTLGLETVIVWLSLPNSSRLLRPLLLETRGKSLCWTMAETRRKVIRKGNEEKRIDVTLGVRPPGRHSSQASENMEL